MMDGATILSSCRGEFHVFPTYRDAAGIAVANAADDADSFYNPIRYGSGWVVEVSDENAEFMFYL